MVNLQDKAMSFGIRQGLKMVRKDPQKNMPILLELIRMTDVRNLWDYQYNFMGNIINDPENIWNKFIVETMGTVDEEILNKFVENFIINSVIKGYTKNLEFQEKYGLKSPWVIVMDPTTACNMRCTGCWAAEYGHAMNLGYELMDRIVNEGKEVGVFFYVFTGGEPLVKKDEVLKLCENHQDCLFLAFTNGTMIDDEFAKKARQVGNLYFSLSVEGTEESTDQRRGKGAYQKVMKAMEHLKNNKCLFGFSTCATNANAEYIMSEEYLDQMIDAGCKYGWYFNYMPVGCSSGTELLTTPEQREKMYHKLNDYRKTKKIFTVDFWNDGRYVGGCIAGGKHYMHINANGDVEPCVFVHYSNANIKDMPLKECLQQPLFKEYQSNQPFSDNLLRPCPLLDNSGKLAEMVHKVNAHSTDMMEPENVDDLNAKTKQITKDWKVVADKLWEGFEKERKEEKEKVGGKIQIED